MCLAAARAVSPVAAEPLAQNANEHENHKYDEYGP